MDDVSFLEQTADADATATLMVLLPDGTVSHIRNVSPFALLDGCPLLYHAFELGANNVQQANIEVCTRPFRTSCRLSLTPGQGQLAYRSNCSS